MNLGSRLDYITWLDHPCIEKENVSNQILHYFQPKPWMEVSQLRNSRRSVDFVDLSDGITKFKY